MKEKHNPTKGLRFSTIPNCLMRRRELSMGAKLTYGRLNQYAGGKGVAFPGIGTLARELGASKSSVHKYLDELRDQGLIEVKRLGLGRTNRYYLLAHLWLQDRSLEDISGCLPIPSSGNMEGPTSGFHSAADPIVRTLKANSPGGKRTLPISSPSKGGGLHVRYAHEEEEDARGARVDYPDDDEEDAHSEEGKVVSIHPYDRLWQKIAELDDKYDPLTIREWLRKNRMSSSIAKLDETNAIMRNMPMALNTDCTEKMLDMRRALVDRSSPTLAKKEIRRFHAAMVKDYRLTLSQETNDEYEEDDEAKEA